MIENNRKFVPLAATFALFVLIYLVGFIAFDAMRTGQAFFKLFDAAPFLIVCTVGETFVIISGGIDLSVSGILALSTVVAASLVNEGFSPWVAFVIVLAMGIVFGLVQGLFITYLKVQPFIATLAGLWLGRGLCYVISDQEVRIHDSTYSNLNGTHILIPFTGDVSSANPYLRTGDYITYLVVVAMLVFLVGLFILHLTKFGRTVYAMGGGNGANEISGRLMGLPVNRTKVSVYTLSGFCSALGGILYSIYVNSGHGTHGTGFELTVIAAVVIGGVALTGGEGYMIGALIGVLLTSLIQSLIQYQGDLLSYWTYLFVGALMLLFLFIQSLVAAWNEAAIGRTRTGGARVAKRPTVWYKSTPARYSFRAAIAIVVLAVIGFIAYPFVFPSQEKRSCDLQPMRTDQTNTLVSGDAIIVYERNGGRQCTDVIYAIYPDGHATIDHATNGTPSSSPQTIQIAADELDQELQDIINRGWFTDDFYTTHHTPCLDCYQYMITIKYNGETKTVGAVDGGTDAPSKYWLVTSDLASILPVGG
jgi:ribose/xylose/arabinose/galactoside ABC-type transport system permease subunit